MEASIILIGTRKSEVMNKPHWVLRIIRLESELEKLKLKMNDINAQRKFEQYEVK